MPHQVQDLLLHLIKATTTQGADHQYVFYGVTVLRGGFGGDEVTSSEFGWM